MERVTAKDLLTWRWGIGAPLLLAMLTACAEQPAPNSGAQGPQIPINADPSVVAAYCSNDANFDAAGQSDSNEVAPDVWVTIIPRRGARGNDLSQLASGSVIAKMRNSGTADYPRWALPAGGASCWQVGWRGGPSPMFVSRFVEASAQGSEPMVFETGDVRIIFHDTPHEVDSSGWRDHRGDLHPGGPLGEGAAVRAQRPSHGLFRFASTSLTPAAPAAAFLGEGLAWTTCATNGCCEAGFP
jgi:hypothetical protein